MSGNLILMCGVPGSGKSTYATKLLDTTTVILSRDEIRFEFVGENEDYFSKENFVFEQFCKRTNWCLNTGLNVIADATFINAASRLKFLKRIDASNIKSLEAIVMDECLATCLTRNAGRTGRRFVPEKVISRMMNQFKVPEFSEGFDTIYIYRQGVMHVRKREDFKDE